MIYLQLALAGVSSGAIAALSGLGLVLTYRATGIFNFAQGAVAVFIAYLLWQMNVGWGVPLGIAAPIAILILGPGVGLLLERFVFRPLETRRASISEKLVATLGVFVVLVGFAVVVWGKAGKSNSPNLFPQRQISFTSDLHLGANQLAQLIIVLVSGAALFALFRYSHLGTRIRAVVDRRQLADLSGVNANRVAALAWALGCGFAGLSGVLLAPQLILDPYHLTLLVIATFAVGVVARLTGMPLAVASGIGLGVLQSEMTRWNPPQPWDSLRPNVYVVTLIAFLLLYRTLDERSDDSASRGLVANVVGADRSLGRRIGFLVPAALVVPLVPFALSGQDLQSANEVLALAVVLVSITAVTGFTGNITLGQAGFAGLGAVGTAQINNQGLLFIPKMPVIPAMLLTAVLVGFVGAFAGYSALRRRGLFLGLMTLAIGLGVYRFIFENPYFIGHATTDRRPNLFGLSLHGDRAVFWSALLVLRLVLVLVDRMRRGRLGRVLAAMRDSETGARSIGIDLRAYKLTVFSVSAVIAALGGALLAQQGRGFD